MPLEDGDELWGMCKYKNQKSKESNMQNVLVVDLEKCAGCKLCEVYCSLGHTKTCNPSRSRIRVIKWDEGAIYAPTVCEQCEDALCVQVCPIDAISVDEAGIVVIDYDMCIGCKICMVVCPFGNISIDPVEDKVVKCDLCGGDPVCAKVCTSDAIKFLSADKVSKVRTSDVIKFLSADKVSLAKRREGVERLANLTKLTGARETGGESND